MEKLALKFEESLPKKPYCTDSFALGLRILTKKHAKQRRYIQHNHINSLMWLVFDVDRATHPKEAWHELNLPAPNFFVQNRDNRHAHLFYLLDGPIHLNPDSSQRAIGYALAIQQAMARELKADLGYSGLISKNPLAENDWIVVINHEQAYSLDELADYLSTLNQKDSQKAIDHGIGFGRNVSLFNQLRAYAYVEVRKFNGGALESFYDDIFSQAVCLNTAFDPSLELRELKHTAKSISKWVWDRRSQFTNFSKQSARGKASGKARRAKSEDKRVIALEMSAKGIKQKEIAEFLGVSKGTISKWLKSVQSKKVS